MSQLSMFSSEELPARPSAWRDLERDFATRVATSCSPLLPLLANIGPDGWFGRTCPESFPAMRDETLEAFWASSPVDASSSPPEGGSTAESYRAQSALMASHGECLTLS